MKTVFLALVTAALAGCLSPGAGPSGPGQAQDGDVACAQPLDVVGGGTGAPRADAGYDYLVRPGDELFLDGSGSSDPQGRPLSYHWGQVAGPCVRLDLANPVQPVLRAPTVQAQATLRFQLVVEAGGRHSEPDLVDVVVTP